MAFLRVLFRCVHEGRSAALVADASSGFLILSFEEKTLVGSQIIDDFLLAMGSAASFLMKGASVEEIETFYQKGQPIKAIKSSLEKREDGTALLRFTSRKKLIFQKSYDDIMDAEMMQDACRDTLCGWQLARAEPQPCALASPLLQRENRTHQVRLLRLLPELDSFGHPLVLEVLENGVPILVRFGTLPRVLTQGNTFTQPDKPVVYRQRDKGDLFGPELILERLSPLENQREEPGSLKPLFEYSLNNVTTMVVPTALAGSSVGYRIDIKVDNTYIDSLLRDPGRGNQPLPLARAIHEAQDMLKLLQGWHLAGS